MAHGNSYEKELPDDFRTRLESSDLTLVTKWAPQQTILNHTVRIGIQCYGLLSHPFHVRSQEYFLHMEVTEVLLSRSLQV